MSNRQSDEPTASRKRQRSISPINHVKKRIKIDRNRKPSESDDELPPVTPVKRPKTEKLPAFLRDSIPENVTDEDISLFLQSKTDSAKLITECSERFARTHESFDNDDSANTRWPPYIVFGSDLIKTWYSSSYPQEYARVPRLYICEFCLKYMKCEQIYNRHRQTCTVRHPPANEIYHKDELSVFEVDGNISRIYCQNLCFLAKSFLVHKTLYYDVEPFLFYVLTRNDSLGCHLLGYFSKEKHCPQKYNLSCITVLPNCQRRGYGRFLIEFSYLISQKEGQFGTPERPLSALGAQTYEAYWKIKIVERLVEYYYERKDRCVLKTFMNETGMAIDDIIETLQNLGVLTMKSNKKPVITANIQELESILKVERTRHAHWVAIDSEYLRFTPVLTPLLLANEAKAVEKEIKEIQIVFKEIHREAAEAALLESNDTIRYIRRRKTGNKRRSILVKRRTGLSMHKSDSLITNDDDEHSQEYVSRRRIITPMNINDEQEQQRPPSSPKLSFKQLKLDRFIQIVQNETEQTSTGKIESIQALIEETLSPVKVRIEFLFCFVVEK